jgi:hypothetical protein
LVSCQPSGRHGNTIRTLISQQHPSGRRGIPSRRPSVQSTSCPDDMSYRSDAHQSKVSSVQTTRTSCPDLPLCREASNYSNLHPSGRFSSPSGRLLVFDQASDFLSKIKYGKIGATVQTTWIPVWTRYSLRQVRNLNSTVRTPAYHGPDARMTDMEIVCSRSPVRMAILLIRTSEAFIRKLLAADV